MRIITGVIAFIFLCMAAGELSAEPAQPTVALTQEELLRLIDAQVAQAIAQAATTRAKPVIDKITTAFAPATTDPSPK